MISSSVNITSRPMGTDIEAESGVLERNEFAISVANLVMCVLGVLSNGLSVRVYLHSSMRASSISSLLLALSLADLTTSLLAMPFFALFGLIEDRGPFYYGLRAHSVVYVYPLLLISQTFSIWLMVVITIERYIAVCHPLKTLSRSSFGFRGILALLIVAVAYNVIRFWEYDLKVNKSDGMYEETEFLRYNYYYYNFYFTGLYILTHFAVPLTIIAILNTSVIITMIRAHRDRGRIGQTSSESGEHSTALMMIVVIVVFIVCNSLLLVTNVMEAADSDMFYDPARAVVAFLLNDVSNFMVLLNCATTAGIYIIFCRRYRHIALSCVSCGHIKPPARSIRRPTNVTGDSLAGSHTLISVGDSRRGSRVAFREQTRIHMQKVDLRVTALEAASQQELALLSPPKTSEPRTYSL